MEQAILNEYHQNNVAVSIMEAQEEIKRFAIFNGLKGELKRDGNQWCATCGEVPEHDITGYGTSPAAAMYNWYQEYFKSISQK